MGKKIQLYSAEIKAFGELVDALRIRPFAPKIASEPQSIPCGDCNQEITEFGGADALKIAGHTKKKYGIPLCAKCAQKRTSETVETVEAVEPAPESVSNEGLTEAELQEFADGGEK